MNKKVLYSIFLMSVFFIMGLLGYVFSITYDIFRTVDSELYYYGFNRLNKYDLIAQQVRPIGRINARLYGPGYNFNGFSLQIGEYGHNFLNKGGEYNGMIVDSICAYGFNNHIVVTELITLQGFRYYDVADFNNFKNSTEIEVDTCCITNPITYFNLSKWINDVNHPTESLCKMSDYCIQIFLIIFFCEIVLIAFSVMFIFKIIHTPSHI